MLSSTEQQDDGGMIIDDQYEQLQEGMVGQQKMMQSMSGGEGEMGEASSPFVHHGQGEEEGLVDEDIDEEDDAALQQDELREEIIGESYVRGGIEAARNQNDLRVRQAVSSSSNNDFKKRDGKNPPNKRRPQPPLLNRERDGGAGRSLRSSMANNGKGKLAKSFFPSEDRDRQSPMGGGLNVGLFEERNPEEVKMIHDDNNSWQRQFGITDKYNDQIYL